MISTFLEFIFPSSIFYWKQEAANFEHTFWPLWNLLAKLLGNMYIFLKEIRVCFFSCQFVNLLNA